MNVSSNPLEHLETFYCSVQDYNTKLANRLFNAGTCNPLIFKIYTPNNISTAALLVHIYKIAQLIGFPLGVFQHHITMSRNRIGLLFSFLFIFFFNLKNKIVNLA